MQPLYLAAKKTTSAQKAFNAVKITEVKRAMQNSPARKRILILDCCYSGRAFEGGMSDLANEVQPAIDLVGTYGIAAVPGDYKALALPGHTLTRFTEYIVDVLKGGIQGDAPALTVGDVFDAVKIQVARDARGPLPEASNWNDGMRFKLAKNRYLKQSGLDRILKGLEGLREALTLSNARLEALEAKVGSVEGLSSRLVEIESRLKKTGNKGGAVINPPLRTKMWDRVGLTEELWNQLPADPFKHAIRDYFDGKRNAWIALIVMMTLLCTSIFSGLLPATSSFDLTFLSGGALYLVFTIVLSFTFYINWRGIPPTSIHDAIRSDSELRYNETIDRIFRTPLINVFGFPFVPHLARLVLIVGALGSTVLIFFMFVSGIWRHLPDLWEMITRW